MDRIDIKEKEMLVSILKDQLYDRQIIDEYKQKLKKEAIEKRIKEYKIDELVNEYKNKSEEVKNLENKINALGFNTDCIANDFSKVIKEEYKKINDIVSKIEDKEINILEEILLTNDADKIKQLVKEFKDILNSMK